MQHATNKLLQQVILNYGMTVGSIAQWSVKNHEQPNVLLYSDLNTNYLYMQMAGHSYSHSRSCDKCSHTFLILTYFHIQIKELRRPGTWLIFVSTSFVLILYSRKTGNEEHPLESYLVFIILQLLYMESWLQTASDS